MSQPSFRPIATGDFEISSSGADVAFDPSYGSAELVVRIEGKPLGQIRLRLDRGAISRYEILRAVETQFASGLRAHDLSQWLLRGQTSPTLPSASIAICTRNRTDDLVRMLPAVLAQSHDAEVIVVDNAPSNDDAKTLVRTRFPTVRYVLEPRPGLDWARNCATTESRSDVILFVDDDAFPDPDWSRVVRTLFSRDPALGAVTGLTLPFELETPAQEMFERTGGFNRGFRRKWGVPFPASDGWSAGHLMGIGDFGVGTNMAYRRSALVATGLFDPALDAGTMTGGAGDLNMLFRVVKNGYKIVYEPGAIVRHRHRRTEAELKRQLFNNGAVVAYLQSLHDLFPDEKQAFRYISRWLTKDLSTKLLRAVRCDSKVQRELAWAEAKGYGHAVVTRTYRRAQKNAQRLADNTPAHLAARERLGDSAIPVGRPPILRDTEYVEVDIDDGLLPWLDVSGLTTVINFRFKGELVSVGHCVNGGRGISDEQLADILIESVA